MSIFYNNIVYFIPFNDSIDYVIKNKIVTLSVVYYKGLSSNKVRFKIVVYVEDKKKEYTRIGVYKDGFYYFKIGGLICKTKID